MENSDNFVNIPELKEFRQWVCWKRQQRSDGKTDKIPITPGTDQNASVSDPLSWSDFNTAYTWYKRGRSEGIGFVFTHDDPFCGIDLDDCRDPETGSIDEWAIDILNRLKSYSEISQSKHGIHIIVKAKLVDDTGILSGTRKMLPGTAGMVEVYDRGRFFCVTGNRLGQYPMDIQERQNEVLWLYRILNPAKPKPTKLSKAVQNPSAIDDDVIIQKASTARNGDKFKRLWVGDWSEYPSASEADLAICSILAFYTQDVDQLLRIIQASGLWDEKWEREDYQSRTIQKAIEGLSEVYNWHRGERHTQVKPSVEKPIQTFALTDMGNGERLAYYHGDNIRFCHQNKFWFLWDGRRWKPDDTGDIKRLAKDVVRQIYIEAGHCEDDDRRKATADHAKHSESHYRQKAMIAMTESELGIPVVKNKLDADPWLLNSLSGTIDLHTGELLPHQREHLITKLVPVEYQSGAKFPLWDTFLQTITDDDKGLSDFLQRAVGYSLTGVTDEEVLFFVHGPAATGKSTFIEAVKAILGEYAVMADFEVFLKRYRDVGSPRNDIASLVNARLVVSIEVEEGKHLAEGLVKVLTGGDSVRARFLYQESFEFLPQLKLWLCANHAPKVKPTDDAIWRRILKLPFNHVIPEGKRDPQVKATLRNPVVAGPAILAWAVEGCLRWQEKGLAVPDIVKRATAEYRQEMDTLETFIDDSCIINVDATVGKKELYAAYKQWCEEAGEKPDGKVNFGRRLKEIKSQVSDGVGDHNIKIWQGIGFVVKAESQ